MEIEINYSFIIPHRNVPHLLQRCIDSIPKRDDIQIIIVDDNSDPKIVNFECFPGLNEKCVEVYFTKEGKGAGYARNIGLTYAKGKWFLFPDADDHYTTDLMNVLDKYVNSNYDIFYFACDHIIEKTMEHCDNIISIQIKSYLEGHKDMINNIRYYLWAPWNKMIKKELICEDVEFEEIEKGNDALFSVRVGYRSTNIKVIKNKIYVYYTREGNISTSKLTFDKMYSLFTSRYRIYQYLCYGKIRRYNTALWSCFRLALNNRDILFAIFFVLSIPLYRFNPVKEKKKAYSMFLIDNK